MKLSQPVFAAILGICPLLVPSACGSPTTQGNGQDGGEVTGSVTRPASLTFLEQVDLTPAGKSVNRPDVISIGNELWLAYKSNQDGPMLQRLDTAVQKLGAATALASTSGQQTTDLRVSSANGQFWMGFESVIVPEVACNEHFVNVDTYVGVPPQLALSGRNIAKGCALNQAFMTNPSGLPANPEIADDPTPFFHNDSHYVLTRAWGETSTIHHVRRLAADLSVAEDILLDTSAVVANRQMSQSALLHIDGKPYLVAGFATGMWISPNTSDLYIIQLSDDLHSFSGQANRLAVTNRTFPTRITRALHVKGTLIINFIDSFVSSTGVFAVSEHLALFDVAAGFSLLSQLQVQDHSVMDNHSSFEVKADRLYLFQQQTGEKISAKTFRLNP